MTAAIEAEGLTKHFTLKQGRTRGVGINPGSWFRARGSRTVHAVDDVGFRAESGRTLAIIGESGCGKSTVAKLLLGLTPATSGSIRVTGERRIQMVAQNPWSALNRRKTIGHALHQPLRIHRRDLDAAGREARVHELLGLTGLSPDFLRRYPADVSGGELQRVTIARALAAEPRVLVLDEPTASLDVSVKAGLVNLLCDLRDDLGLTYLLITHELDVARLLADQVLVMYLGHVVESGTAEAVLGDPAHPYTRSLLDAVPVPDPRRRKELRPLPGEVPSAVDPPSGCRFRTRCPHALPQCATTRPTARETGTGHLTSCHLTVWSPS
ncbi:oligopeptide/dipeptide ABC transporter ATP-binding protein [Streptomyces sp. CAU 1734]|uniref:oligopeptide/dipeptide ABC transporter ATP-binding protein n=1 Tax=Streptomyces sp. CAU 1734 TaxID=3140360 RepID=UPI00326019D8